MRSQRVVGGPVTHRLQRPKSTPLGPFRAGEDERGRSATTRREFWELSDRELELPPLQAAVRAWEETYIHDWPHQALGYRTPAEHLAALGQLHL